MALFTADQLVAHVIGDYILQSHWMATEKSKQSIVAAVHAVTYTVPFLFITHSPAALAAICGTHFVIDRWRLARFVVWFKNIPIYRGLEWNEPAQNYEMRWGFKPLTATGYPRDTPDYLANWLLIITDNIIHVLCNGLAIYFLAG